MISEEDTAAWISKVLAEAPGGPRGGPTVVCALF
jgi:hypothetical protein